jgi:hypothetical protein
MKPNSNYNKSFLETFSKAKCKHTYTKSRLRRVQLGRIFTETLGRSRTKEDLQILEEKITKVVSEFVGYVTDATIKNISYKLTNIHHAKILKKSVHKTDFRLPLRII